VGSDGEENESCIRWRL